MEEIDVLDLGTIEVKQGTDLSEFDGQKKKIEKVTVISVKTDYTEEGEYKKGLQRDTNVLKVESEVITQIDNKDGKKVDIRASELFNLKYDQDAKKWGVSTSEKSKLRKFLNKMKVDLPKQLVGKTVMVKQGEGGFMRFVY